MAFDKQVVDAEQLIVKHLDLWTSAQTAKSTAGRGSNNKIELTGIKKLRELILELAVRGKLVPQDPNDEPASELIKRIEEKRRALSATGELKKQKKLLPIEDADKQYTLPVGWEFGRLGFLSKLITDGTHHTPVYCDSGIPFISVKDIDGRTVSFDNCRYISLEQHLDINKRCNPEKGDLLICRIGTLGRVTIVDTDRPFSLFVSVGLIKLFSDYIRSDFAHMLLSSPFLIQQFESIKAGGSHTSKLNLEDIPKLILVLPPLNEQQKIVQKVADLMILCDQLEQQSYQSIDAHNQLVDTLLQTLVDSANADELASNWQRLSEHFDTLFTTEYSIDALKQTILQLAVMGKLVKQDPTDEPASELLKRIAKEKESLVKAGKIKKQKPLPAITDDEKPADLPFGWEWCRLENLISTMDSGWSPACMPDASPHETVWGVLKTTAVQTLEFREYENKELPEGLCPRPELEVKAGDILITRAGPKNRVGISCLVEKTRPQLMISDKIIRFHLVGEIVSEQFIALCLNAGPTADYLEKSKSGMAESQMNISQDKLKMAPIPLCSLTMQKHIMEKVDQLLAIAENLKFKLKALDEIHQSFSESLIGKFSL